MDIEIIYLLFLSLFLIIASAIVFYSTHLAIKNIEGRVISNEKFLLLEKDRNEHVEQRFQLQFDRYSECITDLATLKAHYNNTSTSRQIGKKIPTRIEILGIWPAYDGLIYEKIAQDAEIESLSKTTFSFAKLDGNNATRASIVNELSINPSINVIQIGAHGDKFGIALSDSNTTPNDPKYDLTPHDWFGKVFKQYNIKLVLLFVCTSNELVDMLYRSGINCVLGFREPVNDTQIIKFLQNFYKFLDGRKSVNESVRLALLSFDNEISSNIVIRGDYTFEE